MQETSDPQALRYLPGERQWLRSALLADQDGILTATRPRLARLARARGVERHDIDDVVQETLLEAWIHLDRLHAPAGFHSWIDEICRNICRRAARRRELDLRRYRSLVQPSSATDYGKEAEEADLLAADAHDPLEELNRQDLVQLLDRALGLLPPATRQIVEMCYLLELPHSEIAARLSLSRSALDVRLHRARSHLRQALHGPLRREAEALGVNLDEALAEGWQRTRLWCPLCACHRLEGCFLVPGADQEPNLHLRCPDCSRCYNQDTVHSMGMVRLSGTHSFRPAWKRTMQGLTDRVMQALEKGLHPCLRCGQPALIRVEGGDTETALLPGPRNREACPYSLWIHMHCTHCGNDIDGHGNLPSVDQLVYWSHPRSQQFLLQHPRWSSEPGRLVEYDGEPAIHFRIADMESSDHLTILAHRQTLRVLTIS
jgi:RNA polymerase sigma factor (sigma-70 family)